MKKVLVVLFIFPVVLSACRPSNSTNLPENTPTNTAAQVVIATETPLSPTFTPPPTLSLPVSQFTPVPSSNTRITAENVENLQETARYYGQINYFAKITKDNKFLFILDAEGLTKYDYSSMNKLLHIPLSTYVYDLQISNDGSWIMIDKGTLIDLRNDKQPKTYNLYEEIKLQNLYRRDFALSPDGSVIALEQWYYSDASDHIFSLISTENFEVLHTQIAPTFQMIGSFSSDGKYIALADRITEVHPDGSTNSGGASVTVWTTKDFTKISSFNVKFPFLVTSIAFSSENSLIAFSQTTSVDIYDVNNEENILTITDLCESYERKIIFVQSSPPKILENSDCSSNTWVILGNTATITDSNSLDFSKITFDEEGNFKTIPYPQPLSNFKAYEWINFNFINNDIISFKSVYEDIGPGGYGVGLYDPNTYSCDFSLISDSFNCQSHITNGKDRILATDDQYYGYIVGKDRVDIYSPENPSQILYSISFKGSNFRLITLDTINKIALYQYSQIDSQIVLIDLENNKILRKWEGSYIRSVVFSENNKIASFCRQTTGGSLEVVNTDRLVFLDLVKKKEIHNENFSCSYLPMAMTSDGNYLATRYWSKDSNNNIVSKLVILNTLSPSEKNFIDINSVNALAYSPNDLILAVACEDNNICFLNSLDGTEIYRLKAHNGITKLAFSKDGNTLASITGWGLLSLYAAPPFAQSSNQIQSNSFQSYNPNFYWNFNQDDNFEGWGEQDWQANGLSDLTIKDGYFFAIATQNDIELYSNEGLDIDASKFSQVEIRMRVSAGDTAVLYFNNVSGDWTGDKGKDFNIFADNEFHTYIINMGNVSNWKEIINQLRLDLWNAEGAAVEIDYIHVLHPGFTWDFDESGNLEGWENWGELDNVDIQGGYLSAKTIGNDPQIYSSKGLDIDAIKFSRIEIRMNVSAGDSAQLFFRNENNDMSENKSIIFPIESGTEFKTYILDISKVATWKNIIYQLRLDPTSDVNGATIEIDYIRLLP